MAGDKIRSEDILASDVKVFDAYIRKIEALEKVYVSFINAVEARGSRLNDVNDGLLTKVKELEAGLKRVNVTSRESTSQTMALVESVNLQTKAIAENNTKTKENTDNNKNLKKAKEELTAEAQALRKVQEKNIKIQDQLNATNTESGKRQAELKVRLQELRKEQKRQLKESKGLITAYDKESARLNELKKAYKAVAVEYGVNSKQAKALVKDVQNLDAELKEIDKTVGDSQRNVGNYASAFEGLGGSAGEAVEGVKSLSAGFSALVANPVVAVIAGLVVALGALVSGFLKTETGAKLLNQASAVLDGILVSITGVADNLRVGLQAVFEDPLGSLKSLGQAIVDNLLNRVQGAIEFVGLLGEGFKQLIDLDFEGLAETASDAGQALIKAGTGIDQEQQKAIVEEFKNLGDQVSENVTAFTNLAEAQRRVRNENRELILQAERLQTEEEKLLAIRDDSTRSFAEREEAGELARQKTEERFATELRVARNTLGLLQEEIKIRKANGESVQDLLDEQLTASQTVIQSERELTNAIAENERERRTLKQDRLERDLDILIDGFDNQKTINEQQIADDRNTVEARRALLEETKQLSDESFKDQISTIQQFTGIAIDENELLNASNAKVLNEKIRGLGLSEIIEGRLLEVVRDRRSANQDLASAERDLNTEVQARSRESIEARLQLERELAEAQANGNAQRLEGVRKLAEVELQLARNKRDEILNLEGATQQERLQAEREFEAERTRIANEAQNRRLEIAQQATQKVLEFAQAGVDFASALNERKAQEAQEQIENLNAEEEQALERSGRNADEREAIEKRFAEKRKAIEEEQARRAQRLARFQKAIDIAQSISQTALAVIKTLNAPPGPPFTIPAAIGVGAFGAIRTGTIIAQPIPAFAEGTESSPFGTALIGEEGRELVVTPSGKIQLASEPQLVDLAGGSKVLNNAITENILNDTASIMGADGIKTGNNMQSHGLAEMGSETSRVIKQLITAQGREREFIIDELKEAFKTMPTIHQWSFTRHGLAMDRKRGYNTEKNVKQENDW